MTIVTLAPNVSLIRGEKSWIEGEAIRQLTVTASLPGMLRCVGMPDIHPAKGSPNGAAFLADRLYPSLVGSDDGCGVSLWSTDMLSRKAKLDRLVSRMDGLDQPWAGDTAQWLDDRCVYPTDYDRSLGTPGHGNHFIEIQKVADIQQPTMFKKLGMSKDHLHVMVHSGSRGFGESIMLGYASEHGAQAVMADSDDGVAYLKQNAQAMAWAVANRQLCAHRVLEALAIDGKQLIDVCHNSVTSAIDGCQCWLHRKGAAPADEGAVVIPGSRGALSFVVQPIVSAANLWSLAHGAGRKINRGDAVGKLHNLYRGKNLHDNGFGGRVICGTTPLLWEEAPECYKSITTVIDDMVQAGLIEVIATLQPFVTFKTSEDTEHNVRKDRKNWQRERSAARKIKR